ncbi:MAG TPA: hypothetical protein VI298_08790 [Geobacteraceae bacterium]
MTRKRLMVTGWLAMASAMLTIPWFILTVLLGEQKGVVPKAAEAAMLVAGTVLTVYLLVALLRLLHEKYAFRQADLPIDLLIKANIVSAAVSLLGLALNQLESAVGVFAIIMVIFVGVLQIAFGVRLLRLPDSLQGLHRPYCYLNIVTGFCLVLLVLLPVGMLTGAVADVMLGTIFFQAAASSE